jgi:hypothetical protein
MRLRSVIGFFVLFLFAGLSAAHAQERFGAIAGVVSDASNAPVPGATVTALNKTTGAVKVTTSGADGMFRIADLEPGRYDITVELSGFQRVQADDVLILLGRTLDFPAQLRIGAVTETVNVTGEAAKQIDLTSVTIAHNVTQEEFDRIPKTRTFQSIALTAPGVNAGEIEGGYQVNGASGAENAFTIDGVVTNSLIYGSSRQNTQFEYLQEVQVKTTGISAEYGGALGGVISAVTKSGGNTFRGEGHYYYEGSGLSAGPVRRLLLSPVDDRTVTYQQDDKMPDHRNEFGGSVGGPIVRDRLFFFGSYSPRLASRTNDYLFSNGTEANSLSRDITSQQAFGKVTYTNNRLTAHGSVLWTPTSADGTLPAYNGSGTNFRTSSFASNAVNEQIGYDINQTNLSGSVDYTLTNASFVSVKGGYFYDNYNDTGIPETTNYIYQTSSVGLAGVPANLQGPIGTQNTPRNIIVNFDRTKRTFVNADYNHAFSAAGSHTLKGGFGFQHTVNEAEQAYPGGYVNIYWDSTFVFGGTSGRGTYGYYEVNNRGVQGTAGADIYSLFVQDTWMVNDRLTLNLGLRTENETVPSFRTDIKENAFQFGFSEKLAPRLGAAYDLRGDGRVKLFGSWGRYYDWTKYELARGSFGGDTWHVYYRGLDTLDLGSLNLSNMPGRDLWVVPGTYRDRRVPNFDTVDPELEPMSQDSLSAGVDYQLNNTSVLTVTYTHNNLRQTIEDVGFLTSGGDEGYVIGNPGYREAAIQFPYGATPLGQPVPKVKRQYDAVNIGVNRRFANNYFVGANYTWSRLYGNYAGLASSDEIRTPTTGVSVATAQQQAGSIARPGANVNRAWDIDEIMWDSHGNLDVLGNLATDRPHVFKAYGAYQFPFGTQVGANLYAGSGTPMTTYVNSSHQSEIFVEGRGDMGRTDMLSRTDLLVSHELGLMNSKRLRFELNVLNIFNQKTSRHLFNFLNRGGGAARPSSGLDLTHVDLRNGYDYNALLRTTPDGANAYDPRYGMDDLFNDGAQGYFSVKFIF